MIVIRPSRIAVKPLRQDKDLDSHSISWVGGTSFVQILPDDLVIKRLLPKFWDHPQWGNLLATEAMILSQVQHPGIVRFVSFENDEKGGSLYLRRIDGPLLSQLGERIRQLDREARHAAARQLFSQLASALRYLHSKKIIHGDLSPENILWNKREGRLQIIDFGAARFSNDPPHFRVGGRTYFRRAEDCGRTSLEGDVFALARIYQWMLGEEIGNQDPLVQAMMKTYIVPNIAETARIHLPFRVDLGQEVVSNLAETKMILFWEKPVRTFRAFAPVLALVISLPILTSWLPLSARITVNTWPPSQVLIPSLDSRRKFETPVRNIQVPVGHLRVEFTAHQLPEVVVRHFEIRPGDDLKIFEDFQNLDTLKR